MEAGETKTGSLISNSVEVTLCTILLEAFKRSGLEGGQIGVISPYRSQLRALQEAIVTTLDPREEIEVNTVDR